MKKVAKKKAVKKKAVKKAGESRRRAFDGITEDSKPCPVCLELAMQGRIQARSVMPLPSSPATLKSDNRKCCRDCVATETTQRLCGNHPDFGAARLTVSNDRVEGMTMPPGLMEHFGFCSMGYIDPASLDDLEFFINWLERNGIPNSCSAEPFKLYQEKP